MVDAVLVERVRARQPSDDLAVGKRLEAHTAPQARLRLRRRREKLGANAAATAAYATTHTCRA